MQPISSSSLHLCPLISPKPQTKWPSRFRAQASNATREAFTVKRSYLLQGDAQLAPAVLSINDQRTCVYLNKPGILQGQMSPFSEVARHRTLEELELKVDKVLSDVLPKATPLASFWKKCIVEITRKLGIDDDMRKQLLWISTLSVGPISMLPVQVARADETIKSNPLYETAEFFELGIQLSYLLLLLALIGVGTFYVIRQVLMRRELDLSAKELQEQVRSGDASATEYFELGAVMLRRKFYPAATKYFLQAIDKWDSDNQDLSQVYNALGVSYVRDGKLDKAIVQFETAVKLQPGYVTAWNNLGDAYEKKKDYKSALRAFEEALLFDPNNSVAQPRRDALKEQVQMYKGVPIKYTKKS